jgi:hypothetical protein
MSLEPGSGAAGPTDDADRALRRMERNGVVACLAMALVALALGRGQPDAALGVLAGGVLAAASYLAIKGGVNLLVRAVLAAAPGPAAAAAPGTAGARPCEAGGRAGEPPAGARPGAGRPHLPRGRHVLAVVGIVVRYALLAVGAYVILLCLRLHPVGVVAGVSTPFVAVAVELVRSLRARR